MPVGFGFSVGDFVSVIESVKTVVDVLRDSGQASSDFRELLAELQSLGSALELVSELQVHHSQHAEHLALRKAAARCQTTINQFWRKIEKYQPQIAGSRSSSQMKTGWMKIRWAVCERDDVQKFKVDVHAHTESIQILLLAIHIHDSIWTGAEQRTLRGLIQDQYQGMMRKLSQFADGMAHLVARSKTILDAIEQIVQTNIRIFGLLLDLQQLIRHMPAQVERQQPICLLDAMGKYSPFHLEFVRSAEAPVTVLQINLKNVPLASSKIRRGKFIIEDLATNQEIDLSSNWETSFRPGQRVGISMVILWRMSFPESCPACLDLHASILDNNGIECPSCGIVSQQVFCPRRKQRPNTVLPHSPADCSIRCDIESDMPSIDGITSRPKFYTIKPIFLLNRVPCGKRLRRSNVAHLPAARVSRYKDKTHFNGKLALPESLSSFRRVQLRTELPVVNERTDLTRRVSLCRAAVPEYPVVDRQECFSCKRMIAIKVISEHYTACWRSQLAVMRQEKIEGGEIYSSGRHITLPSKRADIR